MAAKTFYLKDALASGTSNLGSLSLTNPGASTTGTGWVVGTVVANRFAMMTYNAELASGAFTSSDDLASGPPPMDLFGGAWRSETPLNGTFDATSWTITFAVRAVTSANGQTGRMKVRVLKGSQPDGSIGDDLQLLDGGALTGTTTGALATGSNQTSVVTFTPSSPLVFNNQYLFIDCEWETIGPGGDANADVDIRAGDSTIVTSAFTDANCEDLTAKPVLPRPLFKKAAMAATGLFFVAVPPAILDVNKTKVFESTQAAPLKPIKIQPSALRGESLFGFYSPWRNMGFEVQPWQPPHRASEKKQGALARGNDGLDKALQFFISHGREAQPWQPPHPFREKRGAILEGDDGTQGVYSFVAPTDFKFIEPTQVLQPLKRPQVQRAALRGESIFGFYTQWLDIGFENQAWQSPHRAPEKKYGALERGNDGLGPTIQTFVDYGAHVQGWQPLRPSKAQRGSALKGSDGIAKPMPTLSVDLNYFDIQLSAFRQPNRGRVNGIEGYGDFLPFLDAIWGWENQAYQPIQSGARKRGNVLRKGDDGNHVPTAPPGPVDLQFSENGGLISVKRPLLQRGGLRGRSYFSYFTPWYDHGFVVQPPQPPQRTAKRGAAILRGDDGNLGVFVYVPPTVFKFVEQTPVLQPLKRPQFQRAALRGDSLFAYFSAWKDFNFEVQPPQPPRRAATKGATLSGGAFAFNLFTGTPPLQTADYAWFATPLYQPQHLRRERSGLLFGGSVNLDPFIPSGPPAALEFIEDARQTFRQSIANRRFALVGRSDFRPFLGAVWGWDTQAVQPPRYKTTGHNAIAGSFGFLPFDNAPFVLDQTWQPRVWKATKLVTGGNESLKVAPVALLTDVQWQETTPHPASQVQKLATRGMALRGDDTPPPPITTFVRFVESTPHPASQVQRNRTRGLILRGDETPLPRMSAFFPWHETPWVYPRKIFINGFPAPEGWIYEPPQPINLEFNETVNVTPMRRPRYERGALRGRVSFGYFTDWKDYGFAVQPPQPPHPFAEKRGAILRGSDGIEGKLVTLLTATTPWHEVPWVYPRYRWKGQFLRGVDGIDATLISLLTSDAPWLETPWVYPQAGTWVRVKAAGFLRGHDGIDDIYVYVPPPTPPVEDQRGGGDSRFVHGKHLGIEPVSFADTDDRPAKKTTKVSKRKPQPAVEKPVATVAPVTAPLPPTDLLAKAQQAVAVPPAPTPHSPIEDMAGRLRDDILAAHDETDAQQVLALLQQMQAEAHPPRPIPFREDVVVGQPPAQSPQDTHEAMDMEDAMAALKALNII